MKNLQNMALLFTIKQLDVWIVLLKNQLNLLVIR
ncbi:unnamed protein product [Schistosoma mattheei]|uniref:Uncharacterized protein n=1 Tax=Schistosoma mattheei TaxID=31246 RepID=A0A3P8KH18_9TREM|nr:unnamed protein product [Schistosoma mattheei]